MVSSEVKDKITKLFIRELFNFYDHIRCQCGNAGAGDGLEGE